MHVISIWGEEHSIVYIYIYIYIYIYNIIIIIYTYVCGSVTLRNVNELCNAISVTNVQY